MTKQQLIHVNCVPVSVPHTLCSFSNLLLLQPQKQAWLLFHFVEEETDSERGRVIPKVIQQVSLGAVMWTQVWLQSTGSIPLNSLSCREGRGHGGLAIWQVPSHCYWTTPSQQWMENIFSETQTQFNHWFMMPLETSLPLYYPWVFWTLPLYKDNLAPPHTNYRMVTYLPKALLLHC